MKVAVAISAFRSDEAVIKLVNLIAEERWPVDLVIIVDSLGSGSLQDSLGSMDLHVPIEYHNSEINLGSAGNLQKRMELATDADMDFVLALNHDAVMSRTVVENLLAWTHLENLGALYPLRFRSGKRVFDLTGRSKFRFRTHGQAAAPKQELIEVFWSSSNGALYSTEPLRRDGLRPDGSLWMGWEDYLYGLELGRRAYRQYIVTGARTIDDYEYRRVEAGGLHLTLIDKPTWCMYYSVRNLLRINLYEIPTPTRVLKTFLWVVMMCVHVATMNRGRKAVSALHAYFWGIAHGLLGRSGKWIYP